MAARKKATRKKAASNKIAASSSTRKKAGAARSPQAPKKTATRSASAPPRRASAAETLARKLVRIANDAANRNLEELYVQDCSSVEPGAGPGAVVHGLPALEEKLQGWLSIVESEHWNARSVLVKGNTICIEWQAELKLRDGRAVTLEEVAVHEVRGGKIAAERFYYDPSVLFPPAPPQPVAAVTPPVPAAVPVAEPEPEVEVAEKAPLATDVQTSLFPDLDDDDEPGTPIDPIDL